MVSAVPTWPGRFHSVWCMIPWYLHNNPNLYHNSKPNPNPKPYTYINTVTDCPWTSHKPLTLSLSLTLTLTLILTLTLTRTLPRTLPVVEADANHNPKQFNGGSLSMPSESTCSKLQYDPYLISVACSHPPSYPFRRIFGRSGKASFTEKATIVNWGSQCSSRERTGSNLQYDPYLISVAFSYTELSISVRFVT